ncbi:uncharacterized protein LOC116202797 [Punica granatum]|uniref:Uncharacterized protein n=2 Tax=Punica granatum TaxID=22663 RepID=A0A218XKF9_PUNGR|nr:uncharacterized protein LOC116202797 [Punica granatum]OWM85169.1 hypothetical protein CDL15_Pgr027956 [Punica granatum]PKI32690.1 hypothetical protein CRG98_046919 [Punica granatum]
MGNCLFGGLGPEADQGGGGGGGGLAKVITSNGGVMEFYAPITAGSITDEFPDHRIFRTHDLFWKPLPHHEDLVAGESYYLLPFSSHSGSIGASKCGQVVREGHVRSNSIPAASGVPPYRMSVEYRGTLKRTYTDVFSRYGNSGNDGGRMWKVRLVISPEQLLEILSHEARTQELIESMRAVAKCGAGGGPIGVLSSSSGGFSDQWSLSSSRNASSKTDGLVVDI